MLWESVSEVSGLALFSLLHKTVKHSQLRSPLTQNCSWLVCFPDTELDICRSSTTCAPSVIGDVDKIINILQIVLHLRDEGLKDRFSFFFVFSPDSLTVLSPNSVSKGVSWANMDFFFFLNPGYLKYQVSWITPESSLGPWAFPWYLCFHVWLLCGSCLLSQVEAPQVRRLHPLSLVILCNL